MREKKKEDISGTGYNDGQYPFVLNNCVVLQHKIITLFHFLRLQQLVRQSNHQESRYKKGHMFLMISKSGSILYGSF